MGLPWARKSESTARWSEADIRSVLTSRRMMTLAGVPAVSARPASRQERSLTDLDLHRTPGFSAARYAIKLIVIFVPGRTSLSAFTSDAAFAKMLHGLASRHSSS